MVGEIGSIFCGKTAETDMFIFICDGTAVI